MRDLRDPRALGATLLEHAATARAAFGAGLPLSEIWDVHARHLAYPDYNADPGTLEKYGDPRERNPHTAPEVMG